MFKSNYKILLWILTGLVLILLKSFILPAILGGILALILYKPIRILNLKIKNYKVSVLLTTTICGGVFFIPLVMILISGISDLIVFIKSGVIQEAFNQAPNFLQTNLPKIQASLPLPLENIQKPLTQIIQHISVKG